jgi:hypothetical protein
MKLIVSTKVSSRIICVPDNASPRIRSGQQLVTPTEDQLADIASGKTYWTPSEVKGEGTLSTPPVARYKVSKDAIVSRIAASGKLAEAAAIYASQTDAQKFAWDGYAWFWNDNADLIAYADAVGIPASALLARDSSV